MRTRVLLLVCLVMLGPRGSRAAEPSVPLAPYPPLYGVADAALDEAPLPLGTPAEPAPPPVNQNATCCQVACGQVECGAANCCTADCNADDWGGLSDCGPRWQVGADALFLWRTNSSLRQPVVVDSNARDVTLLSTHDPNFDMATGPRLTLDYMADDGTGWDLVYFGFQQWSASATAQGSADLSLAGDLGLQFPSDFNMADRMRLDYTSTLHNAEVNYVRSLDSVALLAGFRYMHLDEQFNIESTNSITGTSDYHVGTRNDLFGGQIGAVWKGSSGCLDFAVTSKAGLFDNDTGQASLLNDLNNTFPVRNTNVHGNQAAFVGELDLLATCHLTSWLAVRGGYDLLWIKGVALAPDQLDFTTTSTAGTALHSGGGVLLGGFHAGVEAQW